MSKRKHPRVPRRARPAFTIVRSADALEEWIAGEMATACLQCDQVHPVRLVHPVDDLDAKEYWCTGCGQRRARFYPTP